MLVEHEKNSYITTRRRVIYEFFGCSTNIHGPLLLYNNSEHPQFFRGFTGTINHSWLTNQGARIDLVII